MKTCIQCKLEKDQSCFYKRSASPDKLSYRCRDCDKAKRNSYNKEKGPDHFRKYTIIRTARLAGVTVEFIEQAMKDQGYRCKICNVHQDELSKSLCIDHCHTTGKFRGMLCGKCNAGLGYFKDSVSSLRSAIEYLFSCR